MIGEIITKHLNFQSKNAGVYAGVISHGAVPFSGCNQRVAKHRNTFGIVQRTDWIG